MRLGFGIFRTLNSLESKYRLQYPKVFSARINQIDVEIVQLIIIRRELEYLTQRSHTPHIIIHTPYKISQNLFPKQLSTKPNNLTLSSNSNTICDNKLSGQNETLERNGFYCNISTTRKTCKKITKKKIIFEKSDSIFRDLRVISCITLLLGDISYVICHITVCILRVKMVIIWKEHSHWLSYSLSQGISTFRAVHVIERTGTFISILGLSVFLSESLGIQNRYRK